MYIINNISSILKKTCATHLLSSSLIMHAYEYSILYSRMCVWVTYLSAQYVFPFF